MPLDPAAAIREAVATPAKMLAEPERRTVLLWGALGGGAPFLLELAKLFRADEAPTTLTYYAAIVLYAILGVIVVALYGEGERKRAFILGASAPALLGHLFEEVTADAHPPVSGGVEATPLQEDQDASRMISGPISSAHAKAPPQRVSGACVDDRLCLVVPSAGGFLAPEFQVVAAECEGRRECVLGVFTLADTPQRIDVQVPPGASHLFLRRSVETNTQYFLPARTGWVRASIEEKQFGASGFYQAIQLQEAAARRTVASVTFSGVLAWSANGPIEGLHCLSFDEPADPHAWSDNYFCTSEDRGWQWFVQGDPGAGMNCIQISEPCDAGAWSDNFLCAPVGQPTMAWSYENPVPGGLCVQVNEPADPDCWADNYLCQML
ncbi:MAG: hypothetical protein ACOZNI_20050 [Myxococcota bacterium]